MVHQVKPTGDSLPPKAGSPAAGIGRVFVGPREYGDAAMLISRGLWARGHDTTNVVGELPYHHPNRDRIGKHDGKIRQTGSPLMDRIRMERAFIRFRNDHDTWLFLGCRSFQDNNSLFRLPWPLLDRFTFRDLRWLRSRGKTVAMIATGSDIRDIGRLAQDLEAMGRSTEARILKKELGGVGWLTPQKLRRRVRALESCTDIIFSRPGYGHLLSRPGPIYWAPVDRSEYDANVSDNEVPLIVHAPSHHGIKGSAYLEAALDALRQEGYAFRYEACYRRSNLEVKRLLRQASIAVDQLILPGYGLFGAEAMASGTAVVGAAMPGYNGYNDDLPVITATASDIKDRLREALGDPQRVRNRAAAGPGYVEKYHDHVRFAEQVERELTAAAARS